MGTDSFYECAEFVAVTMVERGLDPAPVLEILRIEHEDDIVQAERAIEFATRAGQLDAVAMRKAEMDQAREDYAWALDSIRSALPSAETVLAGRLRIQDPPS